MMRPVSTAVVMAEEIKGKIMKVDVDKKMMTVKEGDKEHEFLVDDKADLGKNKDGSSVGRVVACPLCGREFAAVRAQSTPSRTT